MLIKLFVDDKDYDTEDGFELFSYSSVEISMTVRMALENGFKDIRISEAQPEEKKEFDIRQNKQNEENYK